MLPETTFSRFMVVSALLACATTAQSQTTAAGTVNAVLVNKSGISLIFDTNA
jgi:hypothetical protein